MFAASVVQAAVEIQTCEELTKSYSKYDKERTRLEVSGFRDDSAPRETNRLVAISLILQRQSIVLDMIIARDCIIPEAPDFANKSFICRQNPQNCRE